MNRREFGAAMLGGALTAATPRRTVAARRREPPRVNGVRLNTQLTEIGRFGANPQGGVTRLAYTNEDLQAREAVAGWMREAGLEPAIDVAGNLIGRLAGADPTRAPIVVGSHVDSVPEGGNFDGNVGVLAAVEAVRTMREQRMAPRHPLEVVVWANEEGGLFGSRAVSGQLGAAELTNVARSGKTIAEGITFLGGDPNRLDAVRRTRGAITCYLELHIEQGAVLESESRDIGIVEGIVGIRWWDVTIKGFANHAGTTPMDRRQDAMLAAARFIDMVNRVVTSVPGRHVGTVGRLQASPGAPNVIPGTVVCSLELRDLDDAKLDLLFGRIQTEAGHIGDATGTSFGWQPLFSSPPAPSDPRLRGVLGEAAGALGLSHRGMPSGAGHDAQALAMVGPMGMLFIPSVGGISHAPEEYSHPGDIINGANVLLGALLAADAGALA